MRAIFCAAILAVPCPAVVNAAGMASSANFLIVTPAQPSQEHGDKFAQLVLERAEQFRAQVAKEWLGDALPDGGIRTVVSIRFTNMENSGFTWAKDNPSSTFHNVYLSTSPSKASGAMLNHEIAHTVFATKYPHPNRLPPWVEEGIACRYDDATLIAVRQQEVRSWLRMGRVPRLAAILTVEGIDSFDATNYAAAESLVSFLVTRGDKVRVVRFANEAQRTGWDSALRTYYRIDSIQQLQADWQDWLQSSVQ